MILVSHRTHSLGSCRDVVEMDIWVGALDAVDDGGHIHPRDVVETDRVNELAPRQPILGLA